MIPPTRLAVLAFLALTACPMVPEWFEPDDPGAARPTARPPNSRSLADPVAGSEEPGVVPEAGAPDPNGWDTAPPVEAAPGPLPVPPEMASVPPAPDSASAVPVPPPLATSQEPAPLLPGAKAPGASDADPLYFSFLGREPPELASSGTWITPAAGGRLADLRGQVVYVQFAFPTCPSCALMTPWLVQWHQNLGPQGLVVLYVNNGLMASEDAARGAIAREGLPFAYFHDGRGETLQAFGVRAFPTAYVIDRSGKVVWEGAPLAVEPKIQEFLASLLK